MASGLGALVVHLSFLVLTIIIGGAMASDYCPSSIQPMVCFGSAPYCCGSESRPSGLHCCGDCLLRYRNPCELSVAWISSIIVICFAFFTILIAAAIYCCCCRRRNQHYHHIHHHDGEYTVVTTAGPPSSAGTSSAFAAPPQYNYMQGKPPAYSYGAVVDNGAAVAPSAPRFPAQPLAPPPPPYSQL